MVNKQFFKKMVEFFPESEIDYNNIMMPGSKGDLFSTLKI